MVHALVEYIIYTIPITAVQCATKANMRLREISILDLH